MEKKNKIIIIGLIVIIIALLICLAVMLQTPSKEDTKLSITSKKTLNVGDKIKIKLTDLNGTPISGETINISITDKDGTTDYHSVTTNKKGVGILKLDKDAGNYVVNCSYGGNENYTGNTTSQKLKIKEVVVQEISSNSYSSSSEQEYDPYAGMYEEYSDANGDTVHQFNWGDGSVEKDWDDGYYEITYPDGSVSTGYWPG